MVRPLGNFYSNSRNKKRLLDSHLGYRAKQNSYYFCRMRGRKTRTYKDPASIKPIHTNVYDDQLAYTAAFFSVAFIVGVLVVLSVINWGN